MPLDRCGSKLNLSSVLVVTNLPSAVTVALAVSLATDAFVGNVAAGYWRALKAGRTLQLALLRFVTALGSCPEPSRLIVVTCALLQSVLTLRNTRFTFKRIGWCVDVLRSAPRRQ